MLCCAVMKTSSGDSLIYSSWQNSSISSWANWSQEMIETELK